MIKLPLVKTGQIALLICSLIFSVIPTIFIVLRLVARRIAKRRLDAADYFIMAAWLMTVGLAISIILLVFYGGFGWHRIEVIEKYGEDVITVYHIIILPLEVFWTLSISLSKMSLLILYIKVFPISRLTTASKVTCITVGLLAASGVLCTMLICQPIQGNWDLDLPGRHCGSQKTLFGTYGVLNLITDVMVLGLPIPSLMGLKLPPLRKIGLVATFAVGFLTCVASVIRLAFLTFMDTLDITYTGIPFILMSLVEPSLAVTLACIPLLRPLFPKTATTRYSATGAAVGAAATRGRGERLPGHSPPGHSGSGSFRSSFRGGGGASSLLTTFGSSDYSTTMTHGSRRSSTIGGSNNNHNHQRRKQRGRSSTTSMPAPILQYQYEMGLSCKEGGGGAGMMTLSSSSMIDVQELVLPAACAGGGGGDLYYYQAEIISTGGHESDEQLCPSSGTGGKRGTRGSDPMETISPLTDTSSNIMVKQEWMVLNEVKADVV